VYTRFENYSIQSGAKNSRCRATSAPDTTIESTRISTKKANPRDTDIQLFEWSRNNCTSGEGYRAPSIAPPPAFKNAGGGAQPYRSINYDVW
jgi:hypothetical protein